MFDLYQEKQRFTPAWVLAEVEAGRVAKDDRIVLEFVTPTGEDFHRFDRAKSEIRAKHGLDATEPFTLLAQEETLDLYLELAERHTVGVENVSYRGQRVQWSDGWLADVEMTKRRVLSMLGRNANERFWTLVEYVGAIMRGLSPEKKTPSSTSSRAPSATTSGDVAAPSAPDAPS